MNMNKVVIKIYKVVQLHTRC